MVANKCDHTTDHCSKFLATIANVLEPWHLLVRLISAGKSTGERRHSARLLLAEVPVFWYIRIG
jgi:hypothetical protein